MKIKIDSGETNMNNEKVTELFCPILNKECIGKKCAMAVSINHFTVNPYDTIWQCGLVSTNESNNFGRAQILFTEPIK